MSASFTNWSPSAWYNPNDLVQYAGLNWICSVQNRGIPPNSSTFYWSFFNGGGGGGGGQTLSLVGDNITLSGGGGTVTVGNASSVSSVTAKTTDQSYSGSVTDFANGVTATTFDARSDVIARSNLLIGVLPTQTNVGNELSSLNSQVSTNTTNIATNTSNISSLQTRVAFRDTTEFYVSNNGNDTSGDGSILNPYLTIQKAITQAELISSVTQICFVFVSGGQYTENLTFNKGYVVLVSQLNTQTITETVELIGTVSVGLNTGVDDLFNRVVGFMGFQLGGQLTDTSVYKHSLSFQDCRFYVPDRVILINGSASDIRLFMTNCEISHSVVGGTNPMIEFNAGATEIERCDITALANVPLIRVAGTGTIARLGLSALTSTTTSATAQPIIEVTSTSTSPHSVGNSTFTYTSNTNKSASATSCAIYNNGIAGANYILTYDQFNLTGTNNTNHCVVSASGKQAIVSAFSNCAPASALGFTFTSNIMTGKSPGATYFAFNAVN